CEVSFRDRHGLAAVGDRQSVYYSIDNRPLLVPGAEIYLKARDAKVIMMKPNRSEPQVVTRNGKPVSVILPIKQYEELIERAEDAEDLAWLKKLRRKPLHYRSLKDYLAQRQTRV